MFHKRYRRYEYEDGLHDEDGFLSREGLKEETDVQAARAPALVPPVSLMFHICLLR